MLELQGIVCTGYTTHAERTSCWLVGCIVATGFGFLLTIIMIIAAVMFFRVGGPADKEWAMDDAIQSGVAEESQPGPSQPGAPIQMLDVPPQAGREVDAIHRFMPMTHL
ncbi:MAG: hypothetical protein ACYC0V_10595 [Armatimonadota bacterium]